MVLRTQRNDDRTESAVLFIPDDARAYLRNRIERYGEEDLGNRARPDVDRFESIDVIRAAVIRTLFAGRVDFDARDPVWWEVWIRQPTRRADSVAAAARDANLDVHADRLIFPDTIVLFVHAAVARLIELAQRMPGAISEIRRATGTIEPFLDQGPHALGQVELIEELAGRITPPAAGAPTICVLDTGVAAAHPLIVPALAGRGPMTIGGAPTTMRRTAIDGTAMVGLVLHGDLEGPGNDQRQIQLSHAVELMKFLPPRGFPVTEPARYGFVIQGAVARVEIERRQRFAELLRSDVITGFLAGAAVELERRDRPIVRRCDAGRTGRPADSVKPPQEVDASCDGECRGRSKSSCRCAQITGGSGAKLERDNNRRIHNEGSRAR